LGNLVALLTIFNAQTMLHHALHIAAVFGYYQVVSAGVVFHVVI
jgi:hypothetical protein